MFSSFMRWINHYINSFYEFDSVNQGDKVRIIAPSGKPDIDNFANVERYIKTLGLEPSISEIISNKDDNLFYSNSDELRAKDLIEALSGDSKVVWCYSGGSGANRLIPYLEEKLPTVLPEKKIFIGYSDATVLHLYLQSKYGWPTIHGPMIGQIINRYNYSDSVEKLEDIILSKKASIDYDTLKVVSDRPDFYTPIKANVVGGNLTLLESSIGTDWQIDASGKILFIEDINEAPYSLERSLEHMKQAHLFDNVSAVIFGDFYGSDKKLIEYVEKRFADEMNFPVFTLPDVGHGKANNPLILNAPSSIEISDDKVWTLHIDNIMGI